MAAFHPKAELYGAIFSSVFGPESANSGPIGQVVKVTYPVLGNATVLALALYTNPINSISIAFWKRNFYSSKLWRLTRLADERMRSRDRKLGMDRTISRRDLLHGMGALAAGALCTQHNPLSALERTRAGGLSASAYGIEGESHRLLRGRPSIRPYRSARLGPHPEGPTPKPTTSSLWGEVSVAWQRRTSS